MTEIEQVKSALMTPAEYAATENITVQHAYVRFKYGQCAGAFRIGERGPFVVHRPTYQATRENKGTAHA